MSHFNPEQAMTRGHREFGEHGGVTPSIERSSTFTVLESNTMPAIFNGEKSPENGGCYLYSRHFNPTVDTLARTAADAQAAGIPAVILFGIPDKKDALGRAAYAAGGIVQQAVKAVKDAAPDLVVITDVWCPESQSRRTSRIQNVLPIRTLRSARR